MTDLLGSLQLTAYSRTGPCQLLNKDPTDRPSRKLTEKLLSLKRSGHLSETRHKQPPRMYGLPKIHKPEIPLRPIVSCVNTFAYDLSAHLADILSPLTGKSDYTVTNSSHYNGSIYEQKDGAAMGSPVSTVIVNLYMEGFEERAIATATYKPKIWKRYVDDTFTVLGKDYVDGFLQHLNSQQPTIRFTMEIEKDNTIPFLDTSV